MEVYFDNSATTKPYVEVAQVVYDTMLGVYGNPSSLHSMGKDAEDMLNSAREFLARTVNCTPKELYFTSGGTESDNFAIIGYAMANKKRGNKIISQKTEHKAVLESLAYLEKNGFEIVLLDTDINGFINMSQLEAEINDNTLLVSIMYVNNETGALMPIEKISDLIKKVGCVLHVDAVQAYGKIDINVKKQGIDMLSISAHKIHGPNGVGALYIKNGIRVNPVIYGGQQEGALRSGTENLAGIMGFKKAAEITFADINKKCENLLSLKNYFKQSLESGIPDVVINSPQDSVCNILNVSFTGVKSEVLLHVLESKGIYVSTGSACNSKKNKYSYVLKAMGLKDNIIDSAVRFSFSEFNTKDEIDYTVNILKKEVEILRKIMR